MSDLKTATSAVPSVLVAQALASSDAALYTAPVGTTVKIASAVLVNTDSSARTVTLSVVKSGDTSGVSNRVLKEYSIAAAGRLDLGALGWLAPGDFISGFASVASVVSLVLTGVAFSSSLAAPTGIQLDATGAGSRATSAGTISWSHTVGSASNRYLIVGFETNHSAWVNSWSDYDTLTCSSSVDGAFTRLVSADNGPSAQRTNTVHLFGRANPTNGAHTITCTVTDGTVGTFSEIIGGSVSYTGVGGTSGAVSQSPTSAGVLNLTVASAVGDRPVVCSRHEVSPVNFNRTPRYINSMLLLSDAPGAASVVFANASGGFNAAAGINLVAA